VASSEVRALEKAVAAAKRTTGETVLGHYPEYADVSESLGARRYQIPEAPRIRMNLK